MGQPAARVTDFHTCPLHTGGPIKPPCESTVKVNAPPHARATDRATCIGPDDFIVTGAVTVFVGGQPAARVNEKTMHGGVIVAPCSPNVFIGGPSTGVVLGAPDSGTAACEASGRKAATAAGYAKQSAANCGLESVRDQINKVLGSSLTEDHILDVAMENGWAQIAIDNTTGQIVRELSGGSKPSWRQKLFKHFDIDTDLVEPKISNILQASAENKGVISTHDVGGLRGTSQSGLHSVNVTGVSYNADGTPKEVFVNDTSDPSSSGCGVAIPFERFESSLAELWVNVSADPVW